MSLTHLDSQLISLPFYQSHPYMLPYVGRNYESLRHKKLLLVGESHYLPNGSTVQKDVAAWYNGSPRLTEIEQGWCDTRGTRDGICGMLNKQLNRALKEVADFDEPNALEETASYNYFLRPAEDQGDSIKSCLTAMDREYALRNFLQVVSILRPDVILMTSHLVVDCAENMDYPKIFKGNLWNAPEMRGIKYVYTNHPSSPHWNIAVRPEYFHGLTSREFFVKFLKENWLK